MSDVWRVLHIMSTDRLLKQIPHKNKEIVLFWSAWDEVFGLQLMTAPRVARRDSQSGEILNWCSSTVFCKVFVLKVQLYPYLDDGEMGRELHMMVDEILGIGVDPE